MFSEDDGINWFDEILPRVRSCRAYSSDEEIVEALSSDFLSVEKIWLALKAAEILDGK